MVSASQASKSGRRSSAPRKPACEKTPGRILRSSSEIVAGAPSAIKKTLASASNSIARGRPPGLRRSTLPQRLEAPDGVCRRRGDVDGAAVNPLIRRTERRQYHVCRLEKLLLIP